jgi:hypothetical protein
MRREDAINVMTEVVIKMNMEMGIQQGVPQQQIDMTIQQMKPELDKVNGMLFDALYEHGVINLHN